MEHLAIMKKSLGYLEKITSKEKTIESRWYNSRRAPWDRIKKEDPVYFKNSGCPVTLESKTKKVIQYENLTPNKINKILKQYGKQIGIEDTNEFFKGVKDKRYCILIFLKNIKEIPPFNIDKTGFGIMSAWISLENISQIKKDTGLSRQLKINF